jgi:hypothetical protein
MRLAAIALTFVLSAPAPRQSPPSNARSAAPLIGDWRLDLGRTHYGPGVDRRRSERMTCDATTNGVRCVVRSVRVDGRELTGRFSGAVDGSTAPVTGVPDIDSVQLRVSGERVADATFLFRGKPVFGYRLFRSDDDRSLMIVSVDPVTRVAGTTVVVYDLQPRDR